MSINNKFKLVLPAVLLTTMLIGCSDYKTSAEYIAEAKVAFSNGDNSVAIISLKNVLKAEKNNAEARFLLGSVYAQQGNWLAAEKELNRANQFKYEPQLLFPVLAKVYSHLVDIKGIELLLKEIVDDKNLEQSLKYFMGVAYITEGEEFLALSEFTDVVNLDVDSVYGQLGQTWLYRLSEKFDEALEIANRLIDNKAYVTEALEVKANVLFIANEMEASAVEFNSYLKLRHQDNQNRLIYTIALFNSEDFDEAVKQVDYLLKITPNHALLNQMKAQILFYEENYKQAKEYAEVAIQNPGDIPVARIIAGVSAYKMDSLESAYMHLASIKKLLPYEHPARLLLNSIRFQLGYGEEAFIELSEAPLDILDSDLLMYSAQELIKIGGLEQAEQLMLKADQLKPDNPSILYQRGIMKLLRGDAAAADLFKQLLEINPDSDIAVALLVTHFVNDKKYNLAFQIASSVKERNPLLSYTLVGGIYNKRGELGKAKDAFLQVLTLDENHLAALFNLAKITEQQNNNQEAIRYYQRMLDIDNQHMPAILGLIALAKDSELSKVIKPIFQKKLSANPKDSLANFSMVEYYIATLELEQAKKAIAAGLNVIPNDIKLLVSRANIEAYLKEYDKSLVTLNEVLSIDPTAFGAHLSKSKIYLAQDDLSSAIYEQEIIVQMKPSILSFKIRLAELYFKNKDISLVKSLIKKLSDKERSSASIIEFQGRIALLEQNYKRATKLFSDLYTKKPSVSALLNLIESLQKRGLTEKALKLLSEVEEPNKVLPLKLQLKQAELFSLKEPEKAILLYKELAIKTNNHYVILNNLANLYLQQGKNENALSSASIAIQSAPDSVAVQDTYGLALLGMNQNIKALELLEKVSKSTPASLSYKLHYAQALLANSDTTAAKKILDDIDEASLDSDSLIRFKKIKGLL
jgi:putative PEP-CTERM system TPR-repeat lipoprotein